MKAFWNGLFTAFSMYSIFRVPQINWSKETMRYSFCFFPLIGALIGGAVYLFTLLASYFVFSPFLFSLGILLLPLIISGGIHLDGFIDTSDALFSRRDLATKLEILKDPHVGAFGVIMCATYLFAQFGFAGQLYENLDCLAILLLGYPLSRAYSSLSVVIFKMARENGLAHIFNSNSDSRTVATVLISYIVILSGAMIYFEPVFGSVSAVLVLLGFFIHRNLCYRQFGGATGDLAGFFMQLAELFFLFMAMLGGFF